MDSHALPELIALNRRAVDATVRYAAKATIRDLTRPTPCAGWGLACLLRHLIGSHRGFAAAARGRPVGPEVWDGPVPEIEIDPAMAYQVAAEEVLTAFDAPELTDRKLDLHGFGIFAAPVAVGMHFVDFCAHAWDVARTLGDNGELDDDLCEAALTVAAQWPDTPAVFGPGAAFGPHIAVPTDAPAYQRLMGYLGRDPDWAPTDAPPIR
jgi:uncharacterized protein (TIGR03086 family)